MNHSKRSMIIDLQKLEEGILQLSKGYTSFLMEACAVCLDHQNHKSGASILVDGNDPFEAELKWAFEVDDELKNSYGDMQESTEYGATAIALMLAEEKHGFSSAERMSKGLGFDYFLKKDGDGDETNIFDAGVRLEISGILEETDNNTVERRVKSKIDQLIISDDSNLEGHVCVTEFGRPRTKYIEQQ